MIANASDTLLSANPGTLPNMQGAMLDYFQQMTFTTIAKSVVNFELVEVATPSTAMGVRQPFTAQQLSMKPEGQRAWRWETLHAFPDLVLAIDDVVVFSGVRYRVREKIDWKEYGFVEYHVTEDFTP